MRWNSRVIEEAIEAPPPFENRLKQLGVIFEIGYIARDEDTFGAICGDFRGQFRGQAGRFFTLQIIQGEIESGTGECDSARSADSPHGSGHQSHRLLVLSGKPSDLRVFIHSCYNQLVG
ncbi:hypothetical protein SBA5_1080002 [Candidatus Sulfotelmatomonas gaucii]|uniref:Uncharacterized protein n=1 Tax=Candidatus Sulfuritelmatomonas gaucii TaxID=2043161 RepID=A0A2N9L3A6_9BACT|nr:hypothetical protein SBA5_1080002 [Candidatus Sulfotelmatomonas gaucii]